MKHIFLILVALIPFTGLFAQNYDPEYPDPDSLDMVLDEQEIQDLNSGKAVVEESTVLEKQKLQDDLPNLLRRHL